MIGSFWFRFRPAISMATFGICFLVAASGAAYGQDPVAADATAPATEEVVTTETAVASTETTPAPTPLTADEVMGKLSVGIDTIWVMVCGMLVFFMNLGFGCVESGFCRAKNCVNILSKNFVVFAICSIGFWLVGWDLMFSPRH